MAELDYKEPSKEFAFAYNNKENDKKWASRTQENTFVNHNNKQTQQNKFFKPEEKEGYEKQLEEFKHYLPKPFGYLEWNEFSKDKSDNIIKNVSTAYKTFIDVDVKTDTQRKNYDTFFRIKNPTLLAFLEKNFLDDYLEVEKNHTITKPLKIGFLNAITAREAINAYENLDVLDPAYVAVWFHNHPVEGDLLLSNLPVEFQRLPKVSLVRGFQEQQAEPAKEKKIDKTTGREKEEINYDLESKITNNLDSLVSTIQKELTLNKADTNMLSLLADIVVEAGLENDIKKGLENVEGKDKFLNLLNQNNPEYKSLGPNEKIDERERDFLKNQKLTENLDIEAFKPQTTLEKVPTYLLGGAILLASLPLIILGVGALYPNRHRLTRRLSLKKLQNKALGLPTLGGSFMGLELSDEMKNDAGKTSPEAFMEWLKSQSLEQDEPEKKHDKKYREGLKKLNYGDVSIDFDDNFENFKIAATALPVAQTSTLFWDMSVRSKAGYFKHLYVQISKAKDEGDDNLVDVYVGDVLMENLRFIFPESTYGMGRLKAKNLHIQLRHQDLTNTTNLNSLIQGAIFMLMYRMMTDSGQISASADLLHKALGQNIHEGMALDADAQYIGIENFYGTDYGKIGKIELGGDNPQDNVNISVTTKANPDFAQDQNIPNKKFLAEKKGELETLQKQLQSKKSNKSSKSKHIKDLEEKIKTLEQEIAKPEKEVLDSELKSQVNVSLTTNKLRFEEADMISSMVADIAKAKLEDVGMMFQNLKGLENFRVNGVKLGSSMSPTTITDLFFSSNEIIFDALEADEFAYTLKDETKKDAKGNALKTMSIKGCKTKMEGMKLDFYMKYPDYKVGEKFNEDDLPFEKLQIKKLHIPLTSIEDFHVLDEQNHVELTRLNGLSFIRDIAISTEVDTKGLESFELNIGKIDQQNQEKESQAQNDFAFKTKDMGLNGKFILNGMSGMDYKLSARTEKYLDLEGKEQSKRLSSHLASLKSISLGKSELSEFNMGKPSDSYFVSSKKGEVVSLEGIDVDGVEVQMEETFMSSKEQEEEAIAQKQTFKYDPTKTKMTPKRASIQNFNIAKVKGGNLKVNINKVDEKTKKTTPQFALDLGKDGFLENVKISRVEYDASKGSDFLSNFLDGKFEINAFKAPTMLMGMLGKLHKTETGLISVERFYNGTAKDQRGAYFKIKDFNSKFEQPKDKKGDVLDVAAGADMDGMIYDNGRFILKSNSRFTIPRLHWKSGTKEIISPFPAGIDGITLDITPLNDNLYQINQFQIAKIYAQGLSMNMDGFKVELPKQYQTIIPKFWMQGLINKKTLNYVGKGGLKNGFNWNEIKMSLHQDMYHFFRTNMALQAEQLDFEREANGTISLGMQGFKSGLNKNSSNENSLYWNGLSLNTPLENSLVKDPKKPNQTSLFNADKITFKGTPDKDIDGEPIMRKTIIMENPTLNFLPLKGNIYAKNSLGKPSGLSDIQLQDLLLNGKINGDLVAKQIQTEEFKNKYWNKKDNLQEERGKEEAWEITAKNGGFEMNNLHANVRNLDVLIKMLSSEEKPKEENSKSTLKNQDFAFLDNMAGSSVELGFYSKKYRLFVERLTQESKHIKEEDRNSTTDGAYIRVTDIWSEIRQIFFDNVKNKYLGKAKNFMNDQFSKVENLADSLFRAFLNENGDILEYSMEKSFGKQVFLKGQGKKRNDLYIRLSAMAALSAGTLSIETKVLEEFMKSEQLDEIRDKYEDIARKKAERKLYDEIQSKMPSEHKEEKKKDNQEAQTLIKQKKPKKPTMQELVLKNYKNMKNLEGLDVKKLEDIKKIPKSLSNVTSGYIDLLIEFLWYALFEEFAQLNPSLSLNLKYQNPKNTNGGSLLGEDGLMDMNGFDASLKIGQEVYKDNQFFYYGEHNEKRFEFYNYVFKPLISLQNLSTSSFTIPIKTEQLLGNTFEKYDVTDQVIHVDSMQLKSLSLGTLKGWDYEDFRNGTIMEKLQNSPLDARGSGVKINGFRMLIRIPNEKDKIK